MYENINSFIDRLVAESTPDKPLWNIENILLGRKPQWNYIDGCMMTALLSLGEITGDKKFFDFVENFIDYYVDDEGNIRGYDQEKYNLDDVNEGRVLFDLYNKTKKEKYLKAIDNLHTQLLHQPRTSTGNFWHKKIYPEQIWLDGLYMAQVFALRYEKELGSKDYSDVARQVTNVYKLMRDEQTGLYYHAIDCAKKQFWADKKTGLSKSFWLRAIGWYTVCLIDLIDYCDDETVKKQFENIFVQTIESLSHFVDSETKMLFQVVDQIGRKGNYPETSGSSMVAYAMMKGARLGVLDKKYSQTGREIFDGICNKYLCFENGNISLGGICIMAGVGPDDKPHRDGTFEYYVSERVVSNDAKGVAPFVMCYAEIRRLEK